MVVSRGRGTDNTEGVELMFMCPYMVVRIVRGTDNREVVEWIVMCP